MKFKTRKQKLLEYNDKYADRTDDINIELRRYFNDRNWDMENAIKKANQKIKKILDNREYETIRIILYEYPMKTDRPRTIRGHTFSPNAAENHSYFEKAWKSVVKSLKVINTPAEITVDVYMEMPVKVKADEVLLFESKLLDVIDTPDYDNVAKCYTDMLKNIVVVDDDLFHVGLVRKYYSVLPRVEITIRYIKLHESEYVYKKLKGRKSIKELQASGRVDLQLIDY